MTKSELLKALEPFDDNKQIYFSLPGCTQIYGAEEVSETAHGNNPCIESLETPSFDDICGMAGACLDGYRRFMTEFQIDLLTNIADGPYKE